MQIDFFLTLQNVSVLFLLIVIGFIAGSTNLISVEGQKDITQLVLYVTMPATIISAMQVEMNTQRLQTSMIIFIILIFCYIFMYVVGHFTSKSLPIKKGQQDIFQVALLLSNTSFMGYPIILSLLGPDALFYAVVGAGFIFECVAWSLGTYLISRNGTETAVFNWKKIVFSPGILSILVGLAVFIFQLSIPEPFNSVITAISPATSPLAMIVIGIMLSRSNIKEAFQNKTLYLAAALKLLVIPMIILFTLKFLGFTGASLVIPVIMMSMPSASYVAMFSSNYGNDEQYSSQVVFLTSLLSMLTIPIITTFL